MVCLVSYHCCIKQNHELTNVRVFWIDPLAYAYDALASNEFNNNILPCVGPNLVPNGPGYASAVNQACTGVRGAVEGATSVTGTQYLESLSYSHSHVWRNVGIIWYENL